ncbi:porin family protein [Ketobacter sp. MCCC 1A13808]|nr:porin family protein [Ketobacter sp. MCCC 1A13808]
MQRMKRIFLILLVASSNSYSGGYFGFELGHTKFRYNSDYIVDIKEDKTSNRFLAGYAFDPYFSIEASYFDTQNFNADIDLRSSPGDPPAPIKGNFRVKNKALAFRGSYPFTQKISAFASLGISRWDMSMDITDYGLSDSDNGLTYPVGIGAELKYDKLTAFYVAARYLDFETGSAVSRDISLSTISIGIKLTP